MEEKINNKREHFFRYQVGDIVKLKNMKSMVISDQQGTFVRIKDISKENIAGRRLEVIRQDILEDRCYYALRGEDCGIIYEVPEEYISSRIKSRGEDKDRCRDDANTKDPTLYVSANAPLFFSPEDSVITYNGILMATAERMVNDEDGCYPNMKQLLESEAKHLRSVLRRSDITPDLCAVVYLFVRDALKKRQDSIDMFNYNNNKRK